MKTETIDISKMDKAEVLMALYANSKPQGLGMLHFVPGGMTRQDAETLLKRQTYFDYLQGRVMKVDLSGDRLDPWGYDRDNGQGAAAEALKSVPIATAA